MKGDLLKRIVKEHFDPALGKIDEAKLNPEDLTEEERYSAYICP